MRKYLKCFNLKLIGFTFIAAIVIRLFIGYMIEIPTESMAPTLSTKKKYLVSKIYKDIDYGDIIVFKKEGNPLNYVKRVIGLPGDSVKLKDNKLFINDIYIDETYVKYNGGISDGEWDIPDDSYFVMGDNRSNSTDSRYWYNPYVKRENIKGKVHI